MTYAPSRLSVAPMMELTDRHFRYFLRRITRFTLLYTEMVTAQAAFFGNPERLLAFDTDEKPLILQLGGSRPELLAEACRIARNFDYDGLNLNAGCPSERVAAGKFGAALRLEPELIAECFLAMKENSNVPVSIKTRIAIEEMTADSDGYDDLCRFAELIEKAGCRELIIHARKARLKGFSPKQNRTRPQLNYELVYRFKKDFPQMNVSINGNIETLDAAQEHLAHVDGVMIGRAAYASAYLLAGADRKIFGQNVPVRSRADVIRDMIPYLEKNMAAGVKPHLITKHMLSLFKGCPGAAEWRRALTHKTFPPDTDFKTVAETLNNVISSL